VSSSVISETETVHDPWVTCFLTSMVIRFFDGCVPVGEAVDYHRVMGVVEGFGDIRDPKAFLLDANNWVPEGVLRELIRRTELASGRKDLPYRAALAHFATSDGHRPALIETIARYLDDVDAVVRFAGLWAAAYTNYLAMQAFARPDEPRTLYILVRILAPVNPLIGTSLLVHGNIEGFPKLYPFVDSVRCEVEYSQLTLSSIVAEFGDNYMLTEEKARGSVSQYSVKDRSTGCVVAVARPCPLGAEAVPGWQDDQALTCDRPGDGVPHTSVMRIERGGVLQRGRLEYPLCEGQLFNAPYTRYRFQWEERAHRPVEQHSKQAMSRALFEHLAGLQTTQRRTLSIFIRNRALLEENAQLREELFGCVETGGMIGKSPAFKELLDLVRMVARTDATVLLTGETGTGKERTARLIHQQSVRQAGRFLGVNCGALAETLLESELFGHELGAFSGAVTQKKGKFEQGRRNALLGRDRRNLSRHADQVAARASRAGISARRRTTRY
jgi:sigma-54 interacting transcriptional regulator